VFVDSAHKLNLFKRAIQVVCRYRSLSVTTGTCPVFLNGAGQSWHDLVGTGESALTVPANAAPIVCERRDKFHPNVTPMRRARELTHKREFKCCYGKSNYDS